MSLGAHGAARIVSVLLLAGLPAIAVPGLWRVLVLAGSMLALVIELKVKRDLSQAFADQDQFSAATV